MEERKKGVEGNTVRSLSPLFCQQRIFSVTTAVSVSLAAFRRLGFGCERKEDTRINSLCVCYHIIYQAGENSGKKRERERERENVLMYYMTPLL